MVLQEAKGQKTVRDAGRKGGKSTSEKHGPEFYQQIRRKGGETTSEKHGPEFYHEIGTKGGHKVRDLINRGKQSEEQMQ